MTPLPEGPMDGRDEPVDDGAGPDQDEACGMGKMWWSSNGDAPTLEPDECEDIRIIEPAHPICQSLTSPDGPQCCEIATVRVREHAPGPYGWWGVHCEEHAMEVVQSHWHHALVGNGIVIEPLDYPAHLREDEETVPR